MKIHQLKGYIQNIYLAEEDNKLLLLDGCSRPDIPLILDFIQETLNRPLHQLTAIIVTHMHPDHAGAAHKLRRLTGAKIYSGQAQKHWYSGFSGKLMFITDLILTLYVAKRVGRPLRNLFYSPHLKPDQTLVDGDCIDEFPQWSIITTPGHTDRDISLWHQPSSCVYVADLAINLRDKIIAPFPVFHPNKYQNSLKKIDALNCKTIYLAHGAPLDGTQLKLMEQIQSIPEKPKTHWRAIKMKFKKLWKQFH